MPINCGFDRREPIVCCPDMRMIVTPPHLVPQDKNPVFPEQQTTTTTTGSEIVSIVSESTTEETVATSTVHPGTTAKQSSFFCCRNVYFLYVKRPLFQNAMNTTKASRLRTF